MRPGQSVPRLEGARLEGLVLERWQRDWSWLFFVLLAVSTSAAVAGLDSDARRAATLVLAASLGLWYWHEVVRTGRALGGRAGALPSLVAGVALWAPLLILHSAFQLLMVSGYQLACSTPGPVRRAVPRIAVVSALGVATTWARAGFQPLALVFYGAVTVVLGLFAALTQAISDQSEQRRRLLEQLEAARAGLAAAERRAGVLAERQRLAREIHDTLAQGFASIVTLSEAARAQSSMSPEVAIRRLEEAGDAARRSLDDARRAIWALRPEALDNASLPRALGELAAGFGSQTGIDTQSAVTGDEYEVPPEAQEALLRIAQEALANVRKHARAHRVRLTLSYLDDAIL